MSGSPKLQTFWNGFTPKTITIFREGYSLDKFGRDTVAGITVAMVAIPLSMAIAKASGTSPDRGLITAIIGGFLISLLGGSRYQIGGPAGAFIVVIASIIERQGFDGLLLATLMAGAFMMIIGLCRLGSYIKYIPHPVLVGFTSGIATIIFSGQIVDLLGLSLSGREPAALIPKLEAIIPALDTVSFAAICVSCLSVSLILVLRQLRPHWPGFLIAIAISSLATAAAHAKFGITVETIGSRFGDIPDHLPPVVIPTWSLVKLKALIPDAITIAFLGSVESLLSAVVADGMTGRRHRSNMELVAQGIANIGTALFGGICATGTIARTATNVRSGGTTPISGIIHAVAILLLMMFAAPLASYIPLAGLAAVLAVVSWNMAERREFVAILRRSRPDAVILLATFLLTIFRDLTEGIAVGVILASFVFMHRMTGLVSAKRLDNCDDDRDMINTTKDEVVYRIEGPFFFGAAAEIAEVLERIGERPKNFVLDLEAMPFCDGTAAKALKDVADRFLTQGIAVSIRKVGPKVRDTLLSAGVDPTTIHDL
jgi:sulfate permease, SulP family